MTSKRCKCSGHYTTNWHRWRVVDRVESGASRVYCLDCRQEWKSRASYVVLLPDHKKRTRSGLTDSDVLSAILDRSLYSVDIHGATVRNAKGRVLAVVERSRKDDPRRGTYRFVSFCVDGRKKKIALHRIVWMVAHKTTVPAGYDVDHQGSQGDDTISNLRLLESSENRAIPNRRQEEEGF